LPSVCGHQAHFQEGVFFFFAPFFLPPRADIVFTTELMPVTPGSIFGSEPNLWFYATADQATVKTSETPQ
jgi:hypothetical protein